MVALTFNARNVAPNTMPEPLPNGVYDVIITKSEEKPTSKRDGFFTEITMVVQGGEFNGRVVKDRLNLKNRSDTAMEIAYGTLSALCHVTGRLDIQDTQQLHGVPFKALVSKVPRDDRPGQFSNDVTGYKDINGNDPGFAGGAGAQSQAAPSWAGGGGQAAPQGQQQAPQGQQFNPNGQGGWDPNAQQGHPQGGYQQNPQQMQGQPQQFQGQPQVQQGGYQQQPQVQGGWDPNAQQQGNPQFQGQPAGNPGQVQQGMVQGGQGYGNPQFQGQPNGQQGQPQYPPQMQNPNAMQGGPAASGDAPAWVQGQ